MHFLSHHQKWTQQSMAGSSTTHITWFREQCLQMMIICDETIIKLMRTHHQHAKLQIEFDFEYMCFLVVGNVETDIVGLNSRCLGEFDRPYLIYVLK